MSELPDKSKSAEASLEPETGKVLRYKSLREACEQEEVSREQIAKMLAFCGVNKAFWGLILGPMFDAPVCSIEGDLRVDLEKILDSMSKGIEDFRGMANSITKVPTEYTNIEEGGSGQISLPTGIDFE